jgi:hypothetical protein
VHQELDALHAAVRAGRSGAKTALAQAQSKYGVKGRPPYRALPYFDPLDLLVDGHPPDTFHVQTNTIKSGILPWLVGDRPLTDQLQQGVRLNNTDLEEIAAAARLTTFSSHSSRVAPHLLRAPTKKQGKKNKSRLKAAAHLAGSSSDFIEARLAAACSVRAASRCRGRMPSSCPSSSPPHPCRVQLMNVFLLVWVRGRVDAR